MKVIGVGGGGGNAVKHMIASDVEGVEFICANTDVQVLNDTDSKMLRLGSHVTKGLGAGANPDVGRQAALEDRERINEVLEGADMVFITAGMGGGTGTGAAPVIAEVAKEKGILTVAVVTRPFKFEGKKRMSQAERGIAELKEHVDSLITIPNEKLMSVMGGKVSFIEAFNAANDVLLNAVQGIADLIIRPGLINLDFADVQTVMSSMGTAMMGTGTASGDERAREAAEAAIDSPLLEDINLEGARGILVNVTAGMDFTLGEFDEVGDVIHDLASDDASVVVGMVLDPELEGSIKVTVVATGLGEGVSITKKVIDRQTDQVRRAKKSGSSAVGQDTDMTFGKSRRAKRAANEQPDRQARVVNGSRHASAERSANFLDLPTFLRRQVD
ncbi:MAG: cell division protein FtsZ [Pseudomonadota bacterium]